jgi:hypothetical protein
MSNVKPEVKTQPEPGVPGGQSYIGYCEEWNMVCEDTCIIKNKLKLRMKHVTLLHKVFETS